MRCDWSAWGVGVFYAKEYVLLMMYESMSRERNTVGVYKLELGIRKKELTESREIS